MHRAATSTQTAEEFAAEFNELAATFGQQDWTEALEQCAPLLLEGVEKNFDTSSTSSGDAWPARKDPGPKHPLLILEGDLKVAATYGNINRVVGGDTLEVGVSKETIPYAGVHQFGSPSQNIAQREYLGISEDVADACTEVIAGYALEALK